MDQVERMYAEWACVRLTQDFCYFIDQRRYADLAALFTHDGVWVRHGIRLAGRAAIVAALESRPSNQFTRHVTTGFHFSEVTPDSARATFYNVSHYTFESGGPPFVYSPEKALILDFEDRFERTSDGWRIAERLTNATFLAAELYDRLRPADVKAQ